MTKLFKLPSRKHALPHEEPELQCLVNLLRYGVAVYKPALTPILNHTTIASALGITRDRVRALLKYSERMSISPESERGHTRGKLTVQHVQYLTADATLNDWAHLSLKERAIMFHRQFPELHVSPTLIRRVYRQFKISFKSIRRTKPPIQIQGGYYGDCFQKMVAGMDEARAKNMKLFYLDETVFSFATFPTRTWYSKHNNICISEKTYRFKTQAVVAAISHENGMEELLCADGAIATSDFIFFLEL